MIKISLLKDGAILDIWQENGVHWVGGTVTDALLSDKNYDKIIIDPKAEQPRVWD